MGGGLNHAFLGNDGETESVLGVGTQVACIVSAGLDEGTLGILGLLIKALIEHCAHHVLHVVNDNVTDVILLLFLDDIMLEHETDIAELLLNILVNHNNGLVVVGNGIRFNHGSVGAGGGNVLEEFLDFGLDVVHVNVAYNDQRLVIGAVPLVIVVAQHLIGEIVHDVHRTDDIALGILRTTEKVLQLAVAHALAGIAAQAPLLMDDTALLVDFLVGEQQAVTPVLEDEHARVYRSLAGSGYVVNDVDGLGKIGIGIVVAL